MSPFEKGAIIVRNKINTVSKQSALLNIHCAGNSISVNGDNSSLQALEEGYIRNSTCQIKGNNNSFIIGNHSEVAGNCSIRIFGNNNTVTIGENCRIIGCSFYITGNNNRISIGDNVSAVLTSFHEENDNNKICIGNGTTFHGRDNGITELVLDEGTTIIIKEDCMISNDISFRTTDSHSVLNERGMRTNPAANIVINDHVWIGMRSLIFKNTVIHKNCIIGAGSFCNKDYEKANCMIAGHPAKIIKENVNWSRDRL